MLISIVGATGTGKSELSLDLAERLAAHGRSAEIVNADATQLYRGMDIGTAKLPVAERRGIPHHMLDVLDVTEDASVARYQSEARAAITAIVERGAVPILVGGSGLYVSSVVHDFAFPARDAVIRAALEAELDDLGPGILHERLLALDPEAAHAIGARNGRRIVRALEVIEITGEPFGAGLAAEATDWMPTVTIGLRSPREELTTRLDARVEAMWRAGLVDEVRTLLPLGLESGVTASRAIGYAQAIAQVKGEVDEREAIESTAALTRKYARRQVSWFRRSPTTHWLDAADPTRLDRAATIIG